jgi:hypothetical protein
MTFHLKILAMGLFFCLLGCKDHQVKKFDILTNLKSLDTTKLQRISSTKQFPPLVKAFLDSVNHEPFLIAEPAEPWNAGCTQVKGEPSRQLISAATNNQIFQMKYWRGGFTETAYQVTIFFERGKVLGYAVGSQPNPAGIP